MPKKINLMGAIGDMIVGSIIPKKAPELVSKYPIVKDILRVGMGASLASSTVSPALFKFEVNIYPGRSKDEAAPTFEPQKVINVYQAPQPQMPVENVVYQAPSRPAPQKAAKGYIALPEVQYNVVDEHPIDLKKETEMIKKSAQDVQEVREVIQEATAVQKPEVAPMKIFRPCPEHHHHQDKPEVLTPILGVTMDIIKRDDEESYPIDLSPGAVYDDKRVLDGIVHDMRYPTEQSVPPYPQYPYHPQAQYYTQPQYPPQNQYQQYYQQPQEVVVSQPDDVSFDTSLIKFERSDPPKPNQWPEPIQQVPKAEKIPFVNKYDNGDMFIKFPDLAFVQKIAEKYRVHVKFTEMVYENQYPNSRVVRVDSFNEEGQYVYFKSFFIDFGNIIDRRTKVFPYVEYTLEGQQAFSFYYVPNKKERGSVEKNTINTGLFNALFSAGTMMLENQRGMYTDHKINSNKYCALITVPTKGVNSKDRSRIFTIVENMCVKGGVFETALQYCPGSRWRFEQSDDAKVTARNFSLTNLNVATNYGSVPKAVKVCRITSCDIDGANKIVVDIEGFQKMTYTVTDDGHITV